MKLLTTIEYDVCGSTNDEAWKYLSDASTSSVGDFCPGIIVSHRQTKGRGRQGRTWISESEGNVFASIAMLPPEKNLNWVPLAAGVAAIEAVQHASTIASGGDKDPGRLRLKWPNDLMWGDAKLGGLLCESRISGERAQGVVVGLGLNVVAAPQIDSVKTAGLADTVLKNHGAPVSPESLAAIRWFFIREWSLRTLDWVTALSEDQTGRLREAWIKHARLAEYSDLTVHDKAGKLVRLKALDLCEDGRLKASTDGGTCEENLVYLDQADSI